jgi:hypothetical protein
MTMENRGLISAGGLEDYLVKLVKKRDQCLGEYTVKQTGLAEALTHDDFQEKMNEVRQLGEKLIDLNERIDDTRRVMGDYERR